VQIKLKELEEALLKRFTSMNVSVAIKPVLNSPDYVLNSIRQLKTVAFGPSEYVLFGQLIKWCHDQGVVGGEEARLLSTF
jgi:hypothetical protein